MISHTKMLNAKYSRKTFRMHKATGDVVSIHEKPMQNYYNV